MKKVVQRNFLIAVLLLLSLVMLMVNIPTHAQEQTQPPSVLIGTVLDRHEQPVSRALVRLVGEGLEIETETQENGSFTLPITSPLTQNLEVQIERHHFKLFTLGITPDQIQQLNQGEPVSIGEVTLVRQINLGFWIATAVFVLVLILIATNYLHSTLAALVGVAILYAISYLGHPFSEALYIFNFQDSLQYIDWNVIFLVMGMMIVIAIVENTGIFQWMAFQAYRVSGGRMWLLLPVLMLLTGIASAFLDNVTTMLLMTPMTVQIALALGINPLALLIPEVMASNVIGVSTLVGTPTNILIGSFGKISFNDFLSNLTPGVLLAFVGLVIYSGLIYRKDLEKAHKPSDLLREKLAESSQITQPDNLKKVGWVGLGMLLMFVFGERIHLIPAVTALIGATALLVWIKPVIEEMIEAVDWTTLVFFMSLFICVGGIQEVGLISYIADGIGSLVGQSLALSMLAVIWLSALLSMGIANIPFTAAMLPVIGFLTATVPGAHTKALYYCLSVGSAMGGNGTLIGASANMVTAGISEAAGYRITYVYFLRKGFPAVLITVALATVWLFIRFG